MGQLRMKVWVEFIGTDGVQQRREIATVDVVSTEGSVANSSLTGDR